MGVASISEYVASLNGEQKQHINAFIEFIKAEYPQLTIRFLFPRLCGLLGKRCRIDMSRFPPQKTISPFIFPMRSF